MPEFSQDPFLLDEIPSVLLEKGAPVNHDEGYYKKFAELQNAYGSKFLWMLSFAQWVTKGVVYGFVVTAMEFLFQEIAVPGPQMQVYRGIAMIPWAMKPVFGLISDYLPIGGYRKIPYLVVSSVLGVASHAMIGFTPPGALSLKMILGCLLLGHVQISVVDLLSEAKYAEKMREKPERGPDLITYVWAGITVGNLLAIASIGLIIDFFGARMVFAIMVLPAALVLIPTLLNWLEDTPLTSKEIQDQRRKFCDQPELIVLVFLMGAVTLTIIAIGVLQDSIYVNFGVSLFLAFVVGGAFLLVLRPVIGLMNTFSLLQTCCVVDLSGANLYFFTDTAEQFPGGPNFTKAFYASGLGVVVALLNLFGMYVYNRYMQRWRYHRLYLLANVLVSAVNIVACLVYTRANVALGLPDHLFVLGTWGIGGIVNMWMWLPSVVLLSQLCPKGSEAIMYALLAGCHNLGSSVSGFAGACLLDCLGVTPSGAINEGAKFQNLWIAGLIQATLPVATLVLLPIMIPDATQSEPILAQNTQAVEDSPLRFLLGYCGWELRRAASKQPLLEPQPISDYGSATI